MKYLGSKNRIARHILPIMLEHRKENSCWVEPFVGGGNMIDKVEGWCIGSDLNEYVIALLNEMTKSNFEAPEISEESIMILNLTKINTLSGLLGTQEHS